MKPLSDSAKEKNLLIIEDEADMCLMLNILLAGKDIKCDHVNSIANAKTYLQSTTPEIVILDNKLQDGFGIDFISYIKYNYPNVGIIMISGYGSARDLALEIGADIFLHKPFTKEELRNSVHALSN